ncbi:CidA/LrgA family protein [Rhizobium rhizophilum]|uniref:CidA/LrgA family protein n=1 Tax=Rhizobium rhizophilum TaxID=1850373 RepID=A0ABY2QV94_9HYPH|nr:CidA/LrgA family protein [Rhizobium rhizophilum]THV12803.1 CidA/LrgA family protein [Rhizobium rhizophilum]
MLRGLALLLLFQLAGESIVFLTGLKIPGPVIGLVLLAVALPLIARFRADHIVAEVERASDTLLGNLGLFFIPAGVGVVALSGVIGTHGTAIFAVLVISALVTLAVTVWVFIAVRRLIAARPSP